MLPPSCRESPAAYCRQPISDSFRSMTNPRRGWLGPLPVWAWVTITIALVIGFGALGILLFTGGA